MNDIKQQSIWEAWQLITTPLGRQYWKYTGGDTYTDAEIEAAFSYNKKENPNSADIVFRTNHLKDFKSVSEQYDNALDNTLNKGWNFYTQLQTEHGFWTGDYGGPMFLLPGLLIASYITETPLPHHFQLLIKKYMLNHQNDDGGWGLHIEDKSTMFGTVMQYVSLRILGMEKNHPQIEKARLWIHENGGATKIPSWGKFYLCLMNVFDWKAHNHLIPAMWLMPDTLPIHPGRYWCHARMVYLGMGYCFGNKIQAPLNEFIESLRVEILTQKFEEIDWEEVPFEVSEKDRYVKANDFLKYVYKPLNFLETFHSKNRRQKAIDKIYSIIENEDLNTNYINIGPVNQVINSIAVWHRKGKDSAEFQQHVNRWFDYLWVAEDGIKMQGYNGSQFWDASFALQALMESNFTEKYNDCLLKTYQFIDRMQIQHDPIDYKKNYRHQSKGGWPFSTIEHAWPITDCSAEGLKIALNVLESNCISDTEKTIGIDRLFDSVNLVLSFQNEDGGWASYENSRSTPLLEKMNPSEIFGDIMIDYSYVECSSSSIQALIKFYESGIDYKRKEIEQAIEKGIQFILSKQLEDGSWYGSWGVCFTYGAWFGVEALVAYNHYSKNKKDVSVQIKKACNFLCSKQNEDGGWGESFESCVKLEYIQHEKSQIINTAWALLALIEADYENKNAIQKGINYLISMQEPNGDFPQEAISGVFNKNCMETYTSYRNVFPLWALGRFQRFQNH